jgi:hypothetical protein
MMAVSAGASAPAATDSAICTAVDPDAVRTRRIQLR